jgi:uncharacterized Ntn-hydrolase superfamily protein
MTFSIVGRCAETGQLGIAISSSSIAVGARCPWAQASVGAIATQNITLPSLGPQVLDLLADGTRDPADALEAALATDRWRDFRQLTVIDAKGRTAFATGAHALGLHHAVAGDQCVAAGNMLASQQVIAAMVPVFETTRGALADRLLAAMQAAIDAGGEAGPVHSAALKIVDAQVWPLVDLRVDWSDDAPIAALGALWHAYRPQMRDYVTRALDPTAAPSYGVPGDE